MNIFLSQRKILCFNYVKKIMGGTHLASHGIGVDLAHVSPWIVCLDVGHVQPPRVVTIVRDGETRIYCNHSRIYGQYGFRVGFDPRHLKTQHIIIQMWRRKPLNGHLPNDSNRKNKKNTFLWLIWKLNSFEKQRETFPISGLHIELIKIPSQQ